MKITNNDKFIYNPEKPGYDNAIAHLLDNGKWSITVNIDRKTNAYHLDDEGLACFINTVTKTEPKWIAQELEDRKEEAHPS